MEMPLIQFRGRQQWTPNVESNTINITEVVNNLEETYGYFEVVYELDYYTYIVTQAYSVYGPIIGGSITCSAQLIH